MVYVNAGDSKGQQGKVLKVDAQKQRAIVEGVNISKKATKPNAKTRSKECGHRSYDEENHKRKNKSGQIRAPLSPHKPHILTANALVGIRGVCRYSEITFHSFSFP